MSEKEEIKCENVKGERLIIKSFLFHRHSSPFFHLHSPNKWAAAYLHSCSLKHTLILSDTHIHTHTQTCIWGRWHSSATLGISHLFMWLLPKYFTSQLLFHALSECVPACLRDMEAKKKRKARLVLWWRNTRTSGEKRGGRYKTEQREKERRKRRCSFFFYSECEREYLCVYRKWARAKQPETTGQVDGIVFLSLWFPYLWLSDGNF